MARQLDVGHQSGHQREGPKTQLHQRKGNDTSGTRVFDLLHEFFRVLPGGCLFAGVVVTGVGSGGWVDGRNRRSCGIVAAVPSCGGH